MFIKQYELSVYESRTGHYLWANAPAIIIIIISSKPTR